MNDGGMTLIVKNSTRIVAAFAAVFGVNVALTGHITPGGGFAGGVILAAAGILVVLAFGRGFSEPLVNDRRCHLADAAGALAFLLIAVLGYLGGGFFVNFVVPISKGRVGHLFSGGTIPVVNLAILVKVGAGLAGAFLALSGFRRVAVPREP